MNGQGQMKCNARHKSQRALPSEDLASKAEQRKHSTPKKTSYRGGKDKQKFPAGRDFTAPLHTGESMEVTMKVFEQED
jgi:hypothetical protein